MYKFPIGVMNDSFRLPFEESLDMAAKLGAKGIQMYAVHGDYSPEGMNAAAANVCQ